MSRPHPLLVELASGRPVDLDLIDDDVIDSAIEHRMVGVLLNTLRQATDGPPGQPLIRLEALDMIWFNRRRAVMRAAGLLHDHLTALGIAHLFFKGVVEAHRLFPDPGLRSFVDIDVLLAPDTSLTRTVRSIDPDYPHLEALDSLAASGHLTAVTVEFSDHYVDLHTDLLRIGRGSPRPGLWWQHRTPIALPGIGEVDALDDESSLIAFLIHQGRDRFRYLISAVEYRSRISRPVRWELVQQLAEADGVWDQVAAAATVLSRVSGLPLPFTAPTTLRYRTWLRLWSEAVILRGHEGRLRHNRRADWLMPLLARGRLIQTLGWIATSAFPPDALLRIRHPDASGPYLWRAITARSRVYLRRRTSPFRRHHQSGDV